MKLLSWWRKLANRDVATSRRPTRCKRRATLTLPMLVERLEDRVTPAQTLHWTGAGADANWSDPLNWEEFNTPGALGSGDTLIFDTSRAAFAPPGSFDPFNPINDIFNDAGAFNGTFDAGEQLSIAQIQIVDSSAAGNFNITGLPIYLSAGITHNLSVGSSTLVNLTKITLTPDGTVPSNQTFMNNAGQLNIFSPIDLFGSVLTVDGSGNVSASGTVSNSGANTDAIIKGGGATSIGNFTLSNPTNSYDGVTTVKGGTLIVTGNGALGSIAGGTVVNNNGTLAFQGNVNYTTAEPLTIKGGGFAAQGALASLSGNNTFNGPITLGLDASIITAAGNLTLNGTLDANGKKLYFNGAGNTTVNGVISGTSVGWQAGLYETWTSGYNVTNTFGIQLNLPPLYPFMGESSTFSGPFWGTTETWTYQGRIQTGSTFSFGANMDDMVSVKIDGRTYMNGVWAGTPNTTGYIRTNPGWHDIEIRFSNNTGNGGAVNDGLPGSWRYFYGFGYNSTGTDRSTGDYYAPPLDPGDGSLFQYWSGMWLQKDGTGTLNLNGVNTYDGPTRVNAGQLVVSTDQALGTAFGGTTVYNGGTLSFTGGVDYTTLEPLALIGNVTLANVSGTNTFRGPITYNGSGTITVNSAAGSLTLTSGFNLDTGNLVVQGAGNVVLAGNISGNLAAVTTVDNLWWDDNFVNPNLGSANGFGAWVTTNPAPFSGNPPASGRAFQTPIAPGVEYSYFYNGLNAQTNPVGDTITLATGDHLYTYVYIDPVNIPTEIKLVWRNGQTGGWEGGYWGNSDPIGSWGFTQYSATVPVAGQWVKLDIPFSAPTFNGTIYDGQLFAVYGGRATFDFSGYTHIVDANQVTMNGTGSLTLGGNNSYRGKTNVNSGTVVVTSNNALGTTANGTTVANGATLAFSGGFTYSTAEAVSVSGTGVGGNGVLLNIAGNNSFAGPITSLPAGTNVTTVVGSQAGTLSLSGTFNLTSTNLTVSGAGNVTISGRVSALVAPTNLLATPGDTNIALNWGAAVGATSYNVYRSLSSGTETLLQSGLTNPAFTDVGVINGKTYYYQVTAVGSLGESTPSNEYFAMPTASPNVYTASADFSSQQGYRNWFYLFRGVQEYGGGGTWNGTRWQGYPGWGSQQLWANGGHPGAGPRNGPASSIRRWIAPQAGTIDITGSASRADLNNGAGDGVIVSILKNGTTTLWGPTTIASNDYTLKPYVLTGVVVNAGDIIDFVISENGNWNNDSTNFNPTISLTPGAGVAAPPRNINVTPGDQQATLSWAASPSATSYNIYRGTISGGEAAVPVATGVTNTYYTNAGLQNNKEYFYLVVAVNGSGNSAKSYEASVTAGVPTLDTIWADETVPPGAWGTWSSTPTDWASALVDPMSSATTHTDGIIAGTHYHYFNGANPRINPQAGDILYTYVYLDPANPPTEVQLEWLDAAGAAWRGGYWGPDQTVSWTRIQINPSLPPTGQWLRLEVPALAAGVIGPQGGELMVLYGGRGWFDRTGIVQLINQVTKTGTGTLTLSGNNDYMGATNINQGTLVAVANNALGTTAGATIVAAGATLGFGGNVTYSTNEQVTINGTGAGGTGAINNVAGNNTFAGTITLGSASTIMSSVAGNQLTLSGSIVAPNALTFDGFGNTMVTGIISGSAYSAGLWEGMIPTPNSQPDLVSANPMTTLRLTPRMGETGAGWAGNQTWVYTGQFYDADGTVSFGENFSNTVYLTIDGVNRLFDWQPSTPTATGIVNIGMGPKADGWHNFEVRFWWNGGVAAGPQANTGWTTSMGFGFNPAGVAGTSGVGFIVPTDPGDGSLFRAAGGTTSSVTKNGAGLVTLAGPNTYSGPTTVNGGELRVTGLAPSDVTVNSGAILSGTGTTGKVTANASATGNPGNPALNTAGTLNTNALNLKASSTYNAELAASGNDMFNVSGTVTVAGTLNVTFAGGFTPTVGQTFMLIRNDGSDGVAGTFAGLPQGGSFTIGIYTFNITYTGGDGNDVVVTCASGIDIQAPTATASAASVTTPGAVTWTVAVTYTDNVAIDQSTFDNVGDIRIIGPAGFNTPTIAITNVTTITPGNVVVTYRFNARGGSWDQPDNGTYTIVMQANQVKDTSGNAVPTAPSPVEQIGAFQVNIDQTPPTASGSLTSPITSAGGTIYTFTVTYTDAAGLVDVSTIDSGDVTVTGPGGPLAVSLQSISPSGNASSVTATYSFVPPGGSWDMADNGTYTVVLVANQVADTSGNFINPAQNLGTIVVNIDTQAPTAVINPALTNVAVVGGTTYTFKVVYSDNVAVVFSSIGSSDIVVNGPGGPIAVSLVSVTPGSNGPSLTATYSFTPPGGFWDSADAGTYTVTMKANEVWDTSLPSANFVAAGSLGTFNVVIGADVTPPVVASITAPNVTTGGGASYTVTVTYTDNAAIDVSSINASNVTITQPAGVPVMVSSGAPVITANTGTSVTVQYKFTPPGGSWDSTDGSNITPGTYTVNVSGVTDVANPSANPVAPATATFTVNIFIDNTPPVIVTPLTLTNVTTAGATAYTFSVTYTDNVAISVASVATTNVTVEGPVAGSFVTVSAFLITANTGTSVTVKYTVTPPGGNWDIADNGTYTVTVINTAGGVTDTAGNFPAAPATGTFTVNVPAGGAVPAPGTVTIVTDPCDAGKTALQVAGYAGNDVISILPGGTSTTVKVVINGVNRGTYAPTGHVLVYGLDGNDKITIDSTLHQSVMFLGGNGNDTLVGSTGNDILVGSDGNDSLVGAGGRDILIGGNGIDTLYGDRPGVYTSSADGGNILIGNATSYDDDLTSLCAIMDVWSSTASYTTRWNSIAAGTGCPPLDSTTILNDANAVDALFGSGGMNWFWATTGIDRIYYAKTGERTN